jgi:hypothetical protein
VKELREIRVTFDREIEISITYAHRDDDHDAVANPGTKTRTTAAARMARKGLEVALEGLDRGVPIWGGFATDTRVTRDAILLAASKEKAA